MVCVASFVTSSLNQSRVVWITGASSGIGLALAHLYANQGWRVAASARNSDQLKALAKAHPNIHAFPLDVTKRRASVEAASAIEKRLGSIELAILNAGVYLPTELPQFDAPLFDQSFSVNVGGVVNGLNAVLPAMVERHKGQIAIMASVAGYNGLPTSAAYGATKAALLNMAEALAIELKASGVDVHVIAPGFVETPATDVNRFAMPFIVSADHAAQRIFTALEKRQFRISFPRRFTFFLRLMSMMPRGLYVRLAQYFASR